MQNSLYEIIGQTGIFMLCAQTIIHFKPRESYGKYLKMLLSIMILAQLAQPVLRFFTGSSEKLFWEAVDEFQQSVERRMEQAAGQAAQAEQMLGQLGLKELEEQMRKSMEGNIANVEISPVIVEEIKLQ